MTTADRHALAYAARQDARTLDWCRTRFSSDHAGARRNAAELESRIVAAADALIRAGAPQQ